MFIPPFILHSSCHHQIIFSKFNLKIYYSPSYSIKVWHFEEANADLIRRALNYFNGERPFSNTNINEKVCIFNKSVLNILSNFISHKKDYTTIRIPCGLTLKLSLLHAKSKVSKNYRKNKSNIDLLNKLNFLHKRLNNLITKSKNNLYERMINRLNKFQRNPKFQFFVTFCQDNIAKIIQNLDSRKARGP